MTEIINRPQCPKCKEAMIFSFCIRYNEYICVPCGIAKPFFHGLNNIRTSQEEEDALKKKYHNDLNRLAFTQGGGRCGKCDSSKGNNCKQCKFPDKFEYWNKGEVEK